MAMDEMVSSELKEKINEWLKWDRNETTKEKLKELIKQKQNGKLEEIMLKRITFGTAGLRGKMDVGYLNMNDLVIIQTAQGWLKYLQTEKEDLLKENGIIIGYDGRYNSKRWGQITANIFIKAGYSAKLFGNVCPTPFVSFAIAKFNCVGGVMVTASHNPKDDNGYKVFDSNSCQIISPVDRKIQNLIMESLEPLDTSWDVTGLELCPLLSDPLSQLIEDYVKLVSSRILPQFIEHNRKMDLLFTYTPMHGVGYFYIQKLLEAIGIINLVVVEEQKDPDPEFSTVKFPNPEEGESSLKLAFQTAEKRGSFLIIANDPDADRFAFAEKNDVTGKWKIFTGNELGALFGWWTLHCHQIKNPDEPMDNIYMMSSTVSSMILKTMAKKHGFNFFDTLTGFKWMGNKTLDIRSKGGTVLLGYEVEIGFMCEPNVLDKDGVSAAAHFTTLCSQVYREGKQIHEKLEEIYSIYGYHICRNSYFVCSSVDKIKQIFARLRNFNGPDRYPDSIFDGKYKIVSVRDLTTGYDSSEPDRIAKLPLSPEMITFAFDNGFIITLRTSGTEPKIKYYSELCANPDIRDKEALKSLLNEMVEEVLDTFLQPKLHNLQQKDD